MVALDGVQGPPQDEPNLGGLVGVFPDLVGEGDQSGFVS